MKKYILSVIISVLCIGSVFSQFDPNYTQYMLNPSAYNPAAVGESDMIQLGWQPRLQWMHMDSVSQDMVTHNITLHTPLKIGNSLHGVGVRLLSDNFGLFSASTVSLQYAYKMKLDAGLLSLGLNAVVVQVGFLGTKATSTIGLGSYYDFASDVAIPKTDVVGSNLDLGVGAYYSTKRFYAGISYAHLNNPQIRWNNTSEFPLLGTMYLSGGYTFEGADPKLMIKPSGLFRTDFRSFQIELSGIAEYDQKYWGGVSYRFQNALALLAGINYSSFSFGVSYDVPVTSQLSYKTNLGTLEALVIYNFAYVFAKKNTKYKSIRIL